MRRSRSERSISSGATSWSSSSSDSIRRMVNQEGCPVVQLSSCHGPLKTMTTGSLDNWTTPPPKPKMCASIYAAQHQRGVLRAEGDGVADRDIDLGAAAYIGDVI